VRSLRHREGHQELGAGHDQRTFSSSASIFSGVMLSW
jgi:hypothetical protein